MITYKYKSVLYSLRLVKEPVLNKIWIRLWNINHD